MSELAAQLGQLGWIVKGLVKGHRESSYTDAKTGEVTRRQYVEVFDGDQKLSVSYDQGTRVPGVGEVVEMDVVLRPYVRSGQAQLSARLVSWVPVDSGARSVA